MQNRSFADTIPTWQKYHAFQTSVRTPISSIVILWHTDAGNIIGSIKVYSMIAAPIIVLLLIGQHYQKIEIIGECAIECSNGSFDVCPILCIIRQTALNWYDK